MDRYITFKEDQLSLSICKIYKNILVLARTSAMQHVNSIKTNNPHHFESFVKQSNETILNLLNILSPNSNVRKECPLLDEEKLIKEAKNFFAQDIF